MAPLRSNTPAWYESFVCEGKARPCSRHNRKSPCWFAGPERFLHDADCVAGKDGVFLENQGVTQQYRRFWSFLGPMRL